MQEGRQIAEKIVANVEQVIIGKSAEVELVLLALICQGHILIEDVPGVGKTVLAKSIAKSVGCSFKRIQFTPDLLPSDVTGVAIYSQKTSEFDFRPGPIMAQIVLADEINRATPKTQSALLEAMEERQVTVDGTTHPLPRPFLVLATQNPIEYEGTFPLPEAQLDRFMMRVSLGYPSPADEIAIIDRQIHAHPVDDLAQVAEVSELTTLQREVRDVYVDALVKQYIVSLTDASRKHPDVYLGASPRGSIALFRTAQARALLQGRDFATPDDVKVLAEAALAHRIIPTASARMKNVGSRSIVADLLESTPVPGSQVRR